MSVLDTEPSQQPPDQFPRGGHAHGHSGRDLGDGQVFGEQAQDQLLLGREATCRAAAGVGGDVPRTDMPGQRVQRDQAGPAQPDRPVQVARTYRARAAAARDVLGGVGSRQQAHQPEGVLVLP
ncbi:hypothetical protein ACFU7Y_23230 [Kitasatospora sp. NPDC057542]|uniref:hypothetical protein n=1 Tax=Kitasatospora sp. NPDC057542 TaxID=3346162 RepID=UPI00368E9C32